MRNLFQSRRYCKTCIAFTVFFSFGCMPTTQAENKEPDIQKSINEFRKVDLFAIGYIGFVGHISQGQILYEKVLKSSDAEFEFMKTINAPDSTAASKLYSLCGLKNLSSDNYINAKKSVLRAHQKVSTMAGDVMSKESVVNLIERIDKFKCQN